MNRALKLTVAVLVLAMLAGCATTKLTVDDGRKLDDKLVADMRTYGAGASALRPAIVRSAALNDKDCSTQQELPFEAITSYGIDDTDVKIAWVRALHVNEALTVIAADASSGIIRGDVITEVAGFKSKNTLKMIRALVEARDQGQAFRITLASGRKVDVMPLTVCRGHTAIALPLQESPQSYHWTQSIHPIEVFRQTLTPDEALWIVLWTQGLSEEAGVTMKTYNFFVGGLKWIARIAVGIATNGVNAGFRGAAAASGSSATGQVIGTQLAGQAASMMASSAANRASLSGINGIAAAKFDQADRWAFAHMKNLGANPYAALSLHAKLIAQGAAANAFLLDENRLAEMQTLIGGASGISIPVAPISPAAAPSSASPVGATKDNRSVVELDVRGGEVK